MTSTSDSTRSFSTAEVARRLGISPQTVQRWVDSGRLKAWKTPGGHRRIDAQSAELLFGEQQKLQAAASVAADVATPVRVVIVDDDPLDRDLIATLVSWALPGAELQLAGNGFQGLVMIARTAPDIVVADVNMPHMDGFEMIRNVLADSATRPRVLVAVSARMKDELAAFGQLPSEVHLLGKPLDRMRFAAVLRGNV